MVSQIPTTSGRLTSSKVMEVFLGRRGAMLSGLTLRKVMCPLCTKDYAIYGCY